MIREIIKFIDYLEEKSPDIFSKNLTLKEGLYVFLEREGDELVIKEENILRVGKDTEQNNLYNEFKTLYSVSEMINNKSLNSNEKIFIEIGSPFAISISGKGHKKSLEKKLQALEAYFKAVLNYIDKENKQHIKWFEEFKLFAKKKMFEFLDTVEEGQNPKDTFMFYFFMKEPKIEDYQKFYNKYLETKVFLYDLKKGETHGISNVLSGFNVKKIFLKHKSASFEFNYKISGNEAMKLYKFFRLQQKNKILPNPMPIFIDKEEIPLSKQAITFYNSNKDKKFGHKEVIENLLTQNEYLQNFYLIYFQNNLKGSRIVDLDFVPVFKHKLDKPIHIEVIFQTSNNTIHFDEIKTVFDFERIIVRKIFNNQLVQKRKDGSYSLRYFDEIDNNPKYITANIYIQLIRYRKAFYDFIYKSKHQAITDLMFQDIMKSLILDDIRHDNDYNKTKDIKEKLNIWFNLYNYFKNSKNNEDMVNKTKELFEKVSKIAKDEKERMQSDDEFAFASGQLIRTILNKSKTGERTHSLLEPFLQKTNAQQYKLAIARAFETYKHEFMFYKGNKRYEFDKIMSEVMGFEPDEKNLKNQLPLILAGYFAETIFKREIETGNS